MPLGRPSSYSQEIGEEICEAIASTPRGLDRICAENDNFPCARTVSRWLDEHPDFCQRYLRARERQADLLADETLEIADDKETDWFPKLDGDGNVVGIQVNGDAVQRAKLRIDTRLRLAGKLYPKKWGDKLNVGGDKENPLIPLRQFDPSEFGEEEKAMLRHLAQALIAKRQAALEDQSE